jgi:hypothetical protein
MINRLALFIASVAAALTLAVAMAAAGFAPGTAADPPATANPPAAPSPGDLTDRRVQVDTVYLAAPPAQQTITVRKVSPASGEAESEGAEGDD